MTGGPVIACVLAGGLGTRLYPAVRSDQPKQFQSFTGGESLLAETMAHTGFADATVIVTRPAFADRTREAAPNARVLVEPAPLDTGPAVLFAAHRIRRWVADGELDGVTATGEQPVIVTLPADHHVPDRAAFEATMTRGARVARDTGSLVTFGVEPTRPDPGYGYIEPADDTLGAAPRDESDADSGDQPDADSGDQPDADSGDQPDADSGDQPDADSGEPEDGSGDESAAAPGGESDDDVPPGGADCHEVVRFHEKPDTATAREYVERGYLWNAGIFAWTPTALFEAVTGTPLAETAESIAAGDESAAYETAPSVSVDAGLLERADDVVVVPAGFAWDDLGSWDALGRVLGSDADGNTITSEGVAIDATDNVVAGDHHVSLVGVKGLCVVAVDDRVLVVPKAQAHRVREVVERLREQGRF